MFDLQGLEFGQHPPHDGMAKREIPMIGKISVPPIVQQIGDNH